MATLSATGDTDALAPVNPPHGSPSSAQAGSPVNRARLMALLPWVVLVGAWQLAVSLGWLSPRAVASPVDVLFALGSMAVQAGFWSATGQTLFIWLAGLGISILIAVPVGLCLGANAVIYKVCRVVIDFLRTIPPIVLLPLALLVYGASLKTGFIVIVFGSTWPLIIQTMYGVHQVDPLARDVASVYALRRRDIWSRVIAPSAAPFAATGVRIAATMSLTLTIGAELLGGVPGIGNQIALTQTQFKTIPDMYGYVVVATALGVGLNLALMRVERGVLSWHAAHRPS